MDDPLDLGPDHDLGLDLDLDLGHEVGEEMNQQGPNWIVTNNRWTSMIHTQMMITIVLRIDQIEDMICLEKPIGTRDFGMIHLIDLGTIQGMVKVDMKIEIDIEKDIEIMTAKFMKENAEMKKGIEVGTKTGIEIEIEIESIARLVVVPRKNHQSQKNKNKIIGEYQYNDILRLKMI